MVLQLALEPVKLKGVKQGALKKIPCKEKGPARRRALQKGSPPPTHPPTSTSLSVHSCSPSGKKRGASAKRGGAPNLAATAAWK